MDSTILVVSGLSRERRENGWDLLDWLKEIKLEINAMYWFFDKDWTAWRLMIATPLVDSEGPLYVYDKIIPFVKEKFTDEDGLFEDQVYISSPGMNEVRDIIRRNGAVLPERRVIRRISEEEPYIYCLKKSVEGVGVAA